MFTTNTELSKHTRDLTAYADAFQLYADAARNDFKVKIAGEHVLVVYQGDLYQVSHIRDIIKTCRDIFETEEKGLAIWTVFPTGLWSWLLQHTVRIPTTDLIIDLYEAQKPAFDHPDFGAMYLEEFGQFATELLNEQPQRLLNIGKLEDDHQYLPVVAKAIKDHYKNETDFFTDCADLMTMYYPEKFGNGKKFEAINLDTDHFSPENTYYIYSVNEDL